jgi:hypothetical protein
MISYIRMPASEAFMVNETTTHNRASILGIYYFGNSEASALLTPVIGYFIDHFGFYTTSEVQRCWRLRLFAQSGSWANGINKRAAKILLFQKGDVLRRDACGVKISLRSDMEKLTEKIRKDVWIGISIGYGWP